MTTITPQLLQTLFRPRNVALVGASNKSIFSNLAFQNLVDFGFQERMYLINRRGAETHGRPTLTSCGQIGEPVDLAFMMVPQAGTLDALSDAASAGIRNAVVLSSGYGEAGEAGRRAEAELVAHAESLDMLLLGPNHLGFVNFVDRTPIAAIPSLPDTHGSVALLSQSGGSCSQMITFASMCDIGLSYVITLGNEAMVTAAHALDYLVDNADTKAIAIFMESIREPRLFRRAALRAAEVGKAIVVLKAGRSALAARTAAAHTGALVGDDRTADAIFRDLGVIRVGSIEDMLLTASAAAHLGRIDRPGIGVVSVSGGACDIVADTAHEFGGQIPDLTAETTAVLDEILPDYGTAQNPLDTPGGILNPGIFTRAIEVISRDPDIGVVAVVQTVPWMSDGKPYVRQVLVNATGEGMANASVPVAFINQVLQPVTDYTRQIMDTGNIPYVIPGLRHAMFALSKIAWWSERTRALLQEVQRRAPDLEVTTEEDGQTSWSEWRARGLLERAGVPLVPGRLATGVEEAVAAAQELGGGAVTLKVVSPQVLHKSDIGGVRLDVEGEEEIRRAYCDVLHAGTAVDGARVEGVLVSPMRLGGVELLVGVVRDPQWGPILAIALGGVFAEVLDDSTLAPLPVSAATARTMLDSLRGASLLHGARGTKPADLERVAEIVVRIGDLAVALGEELESLEINPLRVDAGEVEAVDAVVTWRAS